MEILGWLGNALFLGGGVVKNPRHTMMFYLIADILYIAMYMLSGLSNAAISMSLTAVRTIFAIILPARYNLYSVIILTLFSSCLIAFNLTEMADILIILAGICIGISCYCRDHFISYRMWMSASQILWIVHSIIFGVYPMIFCCVMILVTNMYALIKYTNIEDWNAVLIRKPTVPTTT